MRDRRVLLAPLLLLLAGCESGNGIAERYELERRLWQAQYFHRRINIALMQASRNDTRLAVEAYRSILAHNPLDAPAASTWDPVVINDVQRIRVSTRVALANLLFLSQRYADAGTLYRETVGEAHLPLRVELDARLGAARSLYLAGENNEAMEQCAAMFREIVDNPDFWESAEKLDDAFLNIPVVTVRMYRDAGRTADYEAYSQLAASFYDRVATTWPSGRMNQQARLGRIQLHLVRSEWDAAAVGLEALIASPDGAEFAQGLTLLLGEVHAFSRGDVAEARRVLTEVTTRWPNDETAYAARYDLAVIDVAQGNSTSGMAALRALEQDNNAPGIVAARAMLARARELERTDQWDEALGLFRRVQQLYPETTPALEAPMLVVKHYVEHGETALADRALDRAREDYLKLMERGSNFSGDRLVVQGALAESYVIRGKPGEAAELLANSQQWDDASAAAGLLQAAEIYASVVQDPEKAAAMLKKCVERFPETRYSRIAQRRLAELSGQPPTRG